MRGDAADGHATHHVTVARAWALVRLGRPRFLAGGMVLYALGALLAAPWRSLDLVGYALGQVAITATQLMTHYVNDYFDVEADRANLHPTRWSGGSGVLPSGQLPRRAAAVAALVVGGLALGVDFAIARRGRATPATPILLVLAFFLSWQYSAPPLRLHARGLGPLTSAAVVGGLTPLVGYGMQDVGWSRAVWLAIVPLMLAQAAMIVTLDLPDREGDEAAGKRTIAVLFGPRAAAWTAALLVCATYGGLALLTADGLPTPVARGGLATLPIGALLVATLLGGAWRRGERFDRLSWRAVLFFSLLALGELSGGAW